MYVQTFGDQTADQTWLLRKLCTRKDSTLLSAFLERVSVALRDEVQRMPRRPREQIPDFFTVLDLLEAYHEQGQRIPSLESCFVTITQLAHYIGFYDENHARIPDPSSTRTLGLCTGMLAAAAVVSAKSLPELVLLAVETVRISFRVGVCAGAARVAVGNDSNASESWSTILSGISETKVRKALAEFHQGRNKTTLSQPYISAVSAMALTLSGPPQTVRGLFKESDTLRQAHRVPLTVFAPYHAGHLYSQSDVQRIMSPHTCGMLNSFRPLSLIHSATTGKCLSAPNTIELFETAIREILCEPVRWDHLLDEVVSQITNTSDSSCIISAFGACSVSNSLVAALKAGGQSNVSVEDQDSWVSGHGQTFGRTKRDKIAIVGMAGRFPEAANHEELWDLLMKGLDVHREVPSDRFDVSTHCDPSGKGKNQSHTPYGCFIKEPGLFDPRFFNMSPREAAQTDPMGRLALVTAYEALEMSGYVPNRTPSTKLHRIGTFYGQTSDDWREINAAENVDTYFITGGVRAFAPGRINYYFKFSGPSFSIDTACSSSLAAIQLACTSLWAGDCDTACAGGLNVLTNPDIFAGLSKGQFLSKTGSCKTFDDAADGYCRGDGCGTVILKRYEDAIADKDNILGCILGAATNHSADAVSITHPHAGAQEFLYKKVLANAGVDAHDISYVEMHGTGTQAGDGIEMTSVTNVFAPRHRSRRSDQPLYLGALKSSIGHGEAASGISSLIKVMLMLQKNAIPANVGIKGQMNRTFPKDLAQRNVHIEQNTVSFPRNGAAKRRLFLNNFSAAGGNTALLLEDGPNRAAPSAADPRGSHVVTVSARSIASLKRNIRGLDNYLSQHPDTELPSLAYTTTARRIQHNYRVAFAASDISKVRSALQEQLKETYSPISMIPTKTAFAFTGQGSQYTGLARNLYEVLPSFRADIEQLNNLARLQGLPSFIPLLDGTDVTVLSPVLVQLGMTCIQVALTRMWAAWGVRPTAVIGHSLGEYAALHVAGVISASDMILLVGRRAELLSESCAAYTHGMLAVKGSEERIRLALGANMIEIACINGPSETVLSGTAEAVSTANRVLCAEGLKVTRLDVPFAFHSSQVQPMLDPFMAIASTVVFNAPSIPVLSPLLGIVVTESGTFGPQYLARHARETVNFWSALTAGRDANIIDVKTVWLEVGAHPVCMGMVKSSLDPVGVTVPSLRRNEDPWKTLTTSLCSLYSAGVPLDFNEYQREFNDSHELLILPTYSFDEKRYWLDYHNNWCLTKGEDPVPMKAVTVDASVTVKPKLSTTSCQRIVREEIHADSGMIVVQSDLSEPKLHAAVIGHLVNDAPLCPSSLYADMAMTVADYLYRQLRPQAPQIGLNVCTMEVHKPLIAKIPPPPEGQHLQLEATADLVHNRVKLKYRSVTQAGQLIQDHGHGTVLYENVERWQEEWSRTQFMVQTQIDLLKQKVENGTAHKILRGMAYKLFQSFVTYNDKYQGMSEVMLDSKNTEASAKVKFRADENDGDFFCAPFWIDSLCHISGFIINAADTVDTVNNAHISHGWGSMKVSRPLSARNEYRSYVRMQPAPGNVSVGDVYIFEGEEIIAVCQGLKFQCIPRKVLNIMLPPAKPPTAPAKAGVAARSKPARSAPASKAAVSVHKPAKSRRFTKASRAQTTNSMTDRVMKIIAMETDVDNSELVDDAAFENLGVDSLMSLTISARFREELDLEISATLFTDYPTVGGMKKFFVQYDGVGSSIESSDSDASNEPSGVPTPFEHDLTTPASSAPSSASSVSGKEIPAIPRGASVTGGEISVVRQIVAEEMGIDVSEITDQADLSDMGMDSLMSLTILSSLREKSGVELHSTFLAANTCIEDIENALGMRPRSKGKEAARSEPATISRPALSEVNEKLVQRDLSKYPPATSVLLQGNPRIASKRIFLFPDGSGSATSYTAISNISPEVAIYGLNCPFMKKPTDFLCGIDGVSALYLAEMRRRQPEGPYIIGGWSAGGVVAYEVASQLLGMGEKVEKLILIDSPCPIKLEPLPARLHHFFDSIGLLGTGKPGGTPGWLLSHFEYSIKALFAYRPEPMARGQAPRTFAIWAKEGVCGRPNDPRPPPAEGEDPRPMKWLLDNRTDFGDNGWAQLLELDNMEFATMDGNHFTMMREGHGKTLAQLIRLALGLST